MIIDNITIIIGFIILIYIYLKSRKTIKEANEAHKRFNEAFERNFKKEK